MQYNICTKCVIPYGYPGVKFFKTEGELICELCNELINNPFDRDFYKTQVDSHLNSIKRGVSPYDVIFSYSGGRDSTAALYIVVKEYGLKPLVVTINHGYKGEKTLANIKRVTENLGLDLFTKYHSFRRIFERDFENNILPCGDCDFSADFSEIVNLFNISTVITGIEVPIKKRVVVARDNFMEIHLLAGLSIGKEQIHKIVQNTPWEDPGYNIYDSDCLIPGISLERIYTNNGFGQKELMQGRQETHVVPFYANLVRYGVCERNDALHILQTLPVSSKEGWAEFDKISTYIK